MALPASGLAELPLAPVSEEVKIALVEAVPGDRMRVSAAVTVDAQNPVFAGHYPGLPVFPGVCQLECAHRTVLAAAQRAGVRAAIDTVVTARFIRMVSPGDELEIETSITQDGRHWMVVALLATRHGQTAKFVLRYRLQGVGT